MTNTPPTKSLPEPAEASDKKPSDPRELVDEVLREARSFLGASEQALNGTIQDPESDSFLSAATPEYTAELGLFAEASTANATKHAESARDLGEHGPMADLFGSGEPMVPETELAVDAGQTELNATPLMSDAAIALDALLAERVAQESDGSEGSSYSMATNDISRRRAAEAERSTLDALEGFGASPPRTTAAEVATLATPETPPAITPAEPAMRAIPSLDTGPSNEHERGFGTALASVSAEPTPEPPVAAANPTGDVAFPAPEESPIRIPKKPSVVSSDASPVSPSIVMRVGAMPFQLVPSSLHRLVTITALSLAIWVPVVWTYAVFGPEFFTGAVSDVGAGFQEPSEPNEPAPSAFDQHDVATATDTVDQ